MSLDIQLTSYTKTGILTVMFNGKRYKYYDVPPFQVKRMKFLLYQKNKGEVVRILGRYARPELYHGIARYGNQPHSRMEKEVCSE